MFIKITSYRDVNPRSPMRILDLGNPMMLFVNTEKIEGLKDLGDGTYMVTLDSGTVEYTDKDGFDTLCKVLDIGEGEAKKDE